MKRVNNYIFAFLISVIMCFTACQSQMVEVTDHHTDRIFTNRYMDSIKGITSTDYEGYWMAEKVLWMDISGKDQGYRGIIYIDETEAQRLLNDYDGWWQETSPVPSMTEVDTSLVQGSDWYCSNAFVKDFSTKLQIKDLRFNGKDAIIFDVHTF